MKPKPAAKTALVTVEPAPLEVMTGDPQWDLARKLRDAVADTILRDVAARIAFGQELLALKRSLGFEGGGRRKELPQVCGNSFSSPRTWPEWCWAELKMSADKADRCIAGWKLCCKRAQALGEDSPVCRLLSKPAAEFDDHDRKALGAIINALMPEQSQRALLEELRILNEPSWKKNLGQDTSAFRKPSFFENPTPDQAANFLQAAYSSFSEAIKAIHRHRSRDEIKAWLAAAPDYATDATKEMGLMEYRYLIDKAIPETISDLEDIAERLAKVIRNRPGAAKPGKKSSRPKKP
jgi:hypothetical protein